MAPERIVMFHGTSSTCLDAIMGGGFEPSPSVRLSLLMAEANGDPDPHTLAFAGTYMTASRDVACGYARHAGRLLGGDPVVFALSVPVADLVPDEDEVLFALACPLAHALGWEEGNGASLSPWTSASAAEVAIEMVGAFGAPGWGAAEAVARALDAMVSAAAAGWDGNPDLFDPELNEGWAEPNWLKALVARPGGLALYRREMDALCRAMAGSDPDRFPCGFESCKGRVVEAIMPGSTGGVVIVAVGSPQDPCLHVDALHLLTDGEEVEADSERWVRIPSARRAR